MNPPARPKTGARQARERKAPEYLQALLERADFSGAEGFSDQEALRALEVITRKRPDVVALER